MNNAIVLVEYIEIARARGRAKREAIVEAARLRLRPILMTSFSFILGVIPLLVASGAGAESRKVLGTTVCFGLLVATAVSLVAVPMLFSIIQRFSDRFAKKG